MPQHILVVDDDPANRRLLTVILEKEGFRVTTAVEGAQAIDQMRAQPPDLVCCDLMMPGVDGFAVLEAMQSQPALAEIPVIIVTAAGQQADAEKALQLGAAGCVLKPYAKAHVLNMIRDLLPPAE